MGLSSAGLTLPSGSEILDSMIDEYEGLTGLTVDRTRTDDQFVMVIATAVATQLGGLYELLQGVYDGTDADAAVGKQAEDAAYLVGVEPDPATRSQATVTLTATAGVVIQAGALVEGGGPDGESRWTVSEDVTSTGSDDVVVTAQEAGPITADPGDIDKIVTVVPGWSAVTNANAASPGEARESEASLRIRRRRALQQTGSASTSAVRAALLDLDYVQGTVVLENNSAVADVISGKSLDPNSVWVFVHPPDLTSDQEDAIASLIHTNAPAATKLMTSGDPLTEVTRDVTDVGGVTSHEVGWDESTAKEADFTVTVTLEAGYELTDVSDALQTAMSDFFDAMTLGQVLREYDLILATSDIPGIDGLAFSALDVGGPETFPYDPDIDGFLTLGTVTVA